ncbi:serine--tRNA ligase [Striga asiatica]|uniref:Serine--tRNA ligase n=1 Tax=Striga asiatica TaxID=4170 RepID=A0A5A7QTS0_STRAF|nr:serine--tRNA ligase [Striga asiatica]
MTQFFAFVRLFVSYPHDPEAEPEKSDFIEVVTLSSSLGGRPPPVTNPRFSAEARTPTAAVWWRRTEPKAADGAVRWRLGCVCVSVAEARRTNGGSEMAEARRTNGGTEIAEARRTNGERMAAGLWKYAAAWRTNGGPEMAETRWTNGGCTEAGL